MKRKILFRGKRVDNGNWIISKGVLIHNDGTVIMIESDNEDGFITSPVIPETVGQFTGLLDKNEVKIFEGDLIKVCNNQNGTLTVEFVNAYVGGWVLSHESTSEKLSLGARKQSEIEVIGNIHEK